MIKALLERLDRRAQAEALRALDAEHAALDARRAHLAAKDDAALVATFDALASSGLRDADARIDAIACAALAAERATGRRARKGQVLAALHMTAGDVVELHTGEGKTLAVALAALALTRAHASVHVLTPNAYLAARDARAARGIAAFFGLRVGHVRQASSRDEKWHGYGAPITYASASDVAFDTMRDLRASRKGLRLIPRHAAAVLDEIDATLIDAASVPLVLGAAAVEARRGEALASIVEPFVRRLSPDVHFVVEQERAGATFTDEGYAALEAALSVSGLLDEGSLFAPGAARTLGAVQAALAARAVLRRDHEYIVGERGRVMPIDRHTGRATRGRRFAGGLQAALEAKEGLVVRGDGAQVDTTWFATFFARYDLVTGTSGTLVGLAEDLEAMLGARTVSVPPDALRARIDAPDRVFATDAARRAAVVAEICAAHARAQPVLVVTRSEEAARVLAADVAATGLEARTLTAKNPRQEAPIVADAAAPSAITIATLVAGRGTDIALGGRDATPERVAAVEAAGGLLVLGVERHAARRIEAQIRGRAGRRGARGRTVFFVSLEDDLFVRHATPRTREALASAHAKGDGAGVERAIGEIVENAEASARQARARRRRADVLRAREEKALDALRARLRSGIASTPTEAPRVLRANVAQRISALVARCTEHDDALIDARTLRRALLDGVGVELDAVPVAEPRDALVAALTTRVHDALEDRLAWALALSSDAERRALLGVVRRGRPWAPLARFRDAFLHALDEGYRAHLAFVRDDEAALAFSGFANRAPEQVHAQRAHESFLSLVERAGHEAVAALRAYEDAPPT